MNIKGKANDHKRIRKLLANLMVLLVAAAFCFAVPGFDTFAAGGSVTVSVPEINDTDFDSEGFEGFTFKVYKVGGYDGANFKLDGDYEKLVTLPSDDENSDDFQKNWMNAASTLAAQIKALNPEPEPVENATFEGIIPGDEQKGSFTFSSSENALYLLVADPAVSGDYSWTPVPAFIRTLNGAETFTYESSETVVKIDKEKIADEYTVMKAWADDNNAAGNRPNEVQVAIYYGDTRVDVVALDNSCNWSYKWKIKKIGDTYTYIPQTAGKGIEKKEIAVSNSATWTVAELTQSEEGIDVSPNMQNYTASISYVTGSTGNANGEGDANNAADADAVGAFTITNSLIPQDEPKSIRITKNIDGYDADMQNVTFSFRIDGYSSGADGSASGTPIWTNHAGITFSPTDALSKEVIINNVPAAVEAITVTEEYSGNYKLDGTPVITREGNVWTVVMNNKHDDNGHGGGVVNKYEDGKAPVQQGL